ncbi:Alkbh6 protein [Colletotrichum sp. SAR11_240]|nr:Alkbh6 protein [Colletotrichum sp. SAR11_240]
MEPGAVNLPTSLEDVRITKLPPSAFYIADFISEEEEQAILQKDGPAYHPVVCTVSLGASLCLNLYQSKEDGALDPEPVWRILQEPRSLLITTDNLYTDYLHGIADTDEDVELSADSIVNWDLLRSKDHYATGRNVRATRTSLTYRDVLQVSKLGAKFGLFGKK